MSPDKSEQEKQRQSKVPEAEIHLYRQGKGPMAVFKSALGDWEQDQLEFREDILEKHDMKLVFAFNPTFSRSVLTYRDVVVVYLDGEPKVCFVFHRAQLLRIFLLCQLLEHHFSILTPH